MYLSTDLLKISQRKQNMVSTENFDMNNFCPIPLIWIKDKNSRHTIFVSSILHFTKPIQTKINHLRRLCSWQHTLQLSYIVCAYDTRGGSYQIWRFCSLYLLRSTRSYRHKYRNSEGTLLLSLISLNIGQFNQAKSRTNFNRP